MRQVIVLATFAALSACLLVGCEKKQEIDQYAITDFRSHPNAIGEGDTNYMTIPVGLYLDTSDLTKDISFPCRPCPDYEYGYWLYRYYETGWRWVENRYPDFEVTDSAWVAWPAKHCTIDTFVVTDKTVIRQLKNDSLNTTIRQPLSHEREEVLLKDFRPCQDTVLATITFGLPPGLWAIVSQTVFTDTVQGVAWTQYEFWWPDSLECPDSVFILSPGEE